MGADNPAKYKLYLHKYYLKNGFPNNLRDMVFWMREGSRQGFISQYLFALTNLEGNPCYRRTSVGAFWSPEFANDFVNIQYKAIDGENMIIEIEKVPVTEKKVKSLIIDPNIKVYPEKQFKWKSNGENLIFLPDKAEAQTFSDDEELI